MLDLSWSPDGRWILVDVFDDGSEQRAIIKLPADGGGGGTLELGEFRVELESSDFGGVTDAAWQPVPKRQESLRLAAREDGTRPHARRSPAGCIVTG